MQSQRKSRSLLSKIAIGVGALAVLCCGLSALSGVLAPGGSGTRSAPTSAPAKSASQGNDNKAASQVSQANATATQAPTATPAPTDTPVPPGSSRANPAPIGASFTAKEFSISVNSVVRPADKVVADGNMFNTKPEADEEYVQIAATIHCATDPEDKCSISPYNFKLYGSKGIVYEPKAFIAGVDGLLESTEFFGGATLENKSIFFLVGTDETNVVLEFEAGLLFRESAFFAIPDDTSEPSQ
jgi:hypothetical protein